MSASGEQVWKGSIGDSDCGEYHKVDRAHSKHLSERDCTLDRVRKGATFVLISDHHVYRIENQDFPALRMFAGRDVVLTGDSKGDDVVVVRELRAQ